jgi:hypothetical protein
LIAIGISAVGHIAYLISRIGPVFRLGSIFVAEGKEKEKWQAMSDYSRLKLVLLWKYPMLSLELLLMAGLVLIMLYLRLTTEVQVSADCSFG